MWAFGGITPSELIDKPLGREGGEKGRKRKGTGKKIGQENGFSDSERAASSGRGKFR